MLSAGGALAGSLRRLAAVVHPRGLLKARPHHTRQECWDAAGGNDPAETEAWNKAERGIAVVIRGICSRVLQRLCLSVV